MISAKTISQETIGPNCSRFSLGGFSFLGIPFIHRMHARISRKYDIFIILFTLIRCSFDTFRMHVIVPLFLSLSRSLPLLDARARELNFSSSFPKWLLTRTHRADSSRYLSKVEEIRDCRRTRKTRKKATTTTATQKRNETKRNILWYAIALRVDFVRPKNWTNVSRHMQNGYLFTIALKTVECLLFSLMLFVHCHCRQYLLRLPRIWSYRCCCRGCCCAASFHLFIYYFNTLI